MSALTFYLLSAAAVFSTLMAISRRELIHAVVYLVLSFFSLALIFFMMGAPLIAALEVLIYAGAIMVLFLFIVMMLEMGAASIKLTPFWKVWGPAVFIAFIILLQHVAPFFGHAGNRGLPSCGVHIAKAVRARAIHEIYAGRGSGVASAPLRVSWRAVPRKEG